MVIPDELFDLVDLRQRGLEKLLGGRRVILGDTGEQIADQCAVVGGGGLSGKELIPDASAELGGLAALRGQVASAWWRISLTGVVIPVPRRKVSSY